MEYAQPSDPRFPNVGEKVIWHLSISWAGSHFAYFTGIQSWFGMRKGII
jgi:hypothetical protein